MNIATLKRRIKEAPPEKRKELVSQLVAGASPERREYLYGVVGERVKAKKSYPLAYAKLWHSKRSSQRVAAQNLGFLLTLILGGNRTGKTEMAAIIAVCFAAGTKEVWVRRFIQKNGMNLEDFPVEPQLVWAVALNFGDSRRYQRPKVEKYLPKGSRWRDKEGKGEAEVVLPNGGKIVFKACDQGRKSFQGDSVNLIWFDEEPHKKEVMNECYQRILDTKGKIILSMTPLKGKTWVYYDYVEAPTWDIKVHWLHGDDNPHVDKVFRELLLSKYGEHERAARLEGKFVTLEGLVFPGFNRNIHVREFEVLPDWYRYGSIDFGSRNPFCYLHGVLDPKDDLLYITHEWYAPNKLNSQHIEGIGEIWEGDKRAQTIWADPEDRQSRMEFANLGIASMRAKKSIRAGLNAVSERLNVLNGKTGIVIHPRCVNLLREIEAYIWAENNSRDKDQPDLPRKKDDHAMDALRYLCMGVAKRSI